LRGRRMKKFIVDECKGTKEFGGIVKMVTTKEENADYYSGIIVLEPGEELGRDIHESDEVFYIIEGTLTIDSPTTNQVIEAKAGEMILIKRQEVHYSKNLGDKRLVIFWCTMG
jgi:mannose-6-phosphate isomerase-like protein (cupin superfamily)